MPADFAASARRDATSRTCPTLPAGPAQLAAGQGLNAVDDRERGRRRLDRRQGASRARWSPRAASPSTTRTDALGAAADLSPATPRRSGRARGSPRAARRPATWSSSVDLPIPGSPPKSAIEPGTKPPPRTRSTSPMPVGRSARPPRSRRTAIGVNEAIPAIARAADGARAVDRGCATVSTSVFHAPHDGHWPAHLGEAAPHCWQRYVRLQGWHAEPRAGIVARARVTGALTGAVDRALSVPPWRSDAWRVRPARSERPVLGRRRR